MLRRPPLVALALVVVSSLAARPAHAQQESSAAPPVHPPEAGQCYGFAFGQWTPPLDLVRAGHQANPSTVPPTPEGRDWAAAGTAASLVLFPAWWPAGVSVEFPRGVPTPGDTVLGRARAFVANGRAEVPRAEVRAWVVPCRRPADARAPGR